MNGGLIGLGQARDSIVIDNLDDGQYSDFVGLQYFDRKWYDGHLSLNVDLIVERFISIRILDILDLAPLVGPPILHRHTHLLRCGKMSQLNKEQIWVRLCVGLIQAANSTSTAAADVKDLAYPAMPVLRENWEGSVPSVSANTRNIPSLSSTMRIWALVVLKIFLRCLVAAMTSFVFTYIWFSSTPVCCRHLFFQFFNFSFYFYCKSFCWWIVYRSLPKTL